LINDALGVVNNESAGASDEQVVVFGEQVGHDDVSVVFGGDAGMIDVLMTMYR